MRAGLHFCLKDIPKNNGQVESVVHFYQQGREPVIYLRHQKSGAALNLSETNVSSCVITTEIPKDTLIVMGRGDVKRFESTFILVPGWDQYLEENNYELYSPKTNDDFVSVKDVFRKWVLNEAGDYSDDPYNQGTAYDFSSVFGSSRYAPHRRRFWPCLSCSSSEESLDYYVEISYDDGNTWQPFTGSFQVLLDECGIYLSDTQMETDMWAAICDAQLAIRITASIDSDEPLEAVINDGPVNSARPIRTYLFQLGREYKYRQVTKGSVFYDNIFTGPSNAVDDSESLREYLRGQLNGLRQNGLAGTTELPWIHPDITPGQIVSGIQGRGPYFDVLVSSDEHKCQINEVKFVFGQKWSTMITFGDS